jgi:dihydrolipoamide dehydrogenase
MAGRAVKIDDQCRTSMRNVWAIGDLTGEPMLAHRAMAQGEMVAEIIAGTSAASRPGHSGGVLHRSRRSWWSGLTPDEAEAKGLDCISSASRSPPTAAR